MCLGLKVLVTLVEDPGLIPSTYIKQPVTPPPMILPLTSGLSRLQHTRANTHTQM